MRRAEPWSVDKDKFIQVMAERGAGSSAEYLYGRVMEMHKRGASYDAVLYRLTAVSHLPKAVAVQLIYK